jgi:AcrR family transcriptional regulator
MQGSAKRGRLAEVSRAARERAVLDAAAAILRKHGPGGFNVRAVAEAAGASTIVVYTLFGGVDGLLAALQQDGLERLADAFTRVPDGDPLVRLGAMALAYRAFARDNPQYYRAFSLTPGVGGEFARRARASRAFALLVEGVRACIKKGLLARKDPAAIADALWAFVHGVVSLELGGYFASDAEAEARLALGGLAMLRGFGTKR